MADIKPRTDVYRTQEQLEAEWTGRHAEFWWLMERLLARGIQSDTAVTIAAQLVTEPRRK